jgi:ribosomal protein L11 methyltransferase
MIPADSVLHIYEIRGDLDRELPVPPTSFIGLWNEEDFSYLFFTRPEDSYIDALVRDLNAVVSSRHEMKYEDWQTGLPPNGLAVGGVCFVPRDHPTPPPGAIFLDPSVVFGDGNHPTTLSCIRFLEQICRTYCVDSLLDLGTGTGILALAGAAKGIKGIVAVDKNRLAARTARENVQANALGAVVRIEEGEARVFLDRPFDVVAANLPFQVLRDLATFKDAGRHGAWIVSGINEEQAAVLRELFLELGYEIAATALDAPWMTFVAIKRNLLSLNASGGDVPQI